jgi:hypothetical protein
MSFVKNSNSSFVGPSEKHTLCRVHLTQLVRFLVMELIHSGSNPRFDICVIFIANYSFSGRQCSHQQQYVLSDRLCKS